MIWTRKPVSKSTQQKGRTQQPDCEATFCLIMRASTLRRLLYAFIIISVLHFLWVWFNERSIDSESLGLDPRPVLNLDPTFRGRSCVMKNGRCIPQWKPEAQDLTKFYVEGREFRLLSGSFHYFRTQPAQWGDRLLKMKAAGLNTVTTYVPWNLHEKVRGQFEFTGRWDLASFIRQVHNVGLKMIVRPGPYICAEWDWGGLPAWLLRNTSVVVRSSADKAYLAAVEAYFAKLLPILASYQSKKHKGPIIAFQVENEFGSYGHDENYMTFLVKQFERYGLTELFMTSDGLSGLEKGSAPGALKTVNFFGNPTKNLHGLRELQPHKPLMVGEWWAGWFDHWGERHHTQDVDKLREKITTILSHYNASMNFYMFVGGTNFEFWNGANGGKSYAPTITSYDYDAAISESGDTTPKYYMIKHLIETLGLAPMDVPEVPIDPIKAAYGSVRPTESMSYTDMVKLLPQDKVVSLNSPSPMEKLDINSHSGQGYGYLLYQKVVEDVSIVQLNGSWADRAIVMYNQEKVATFDWTQTVDRIPVHSSRKRNTLEVLVENTGRVNFKQLNRQTKGILGSLLGDGQKLLGDWLHAPLEFDEPFNALLTKSPRWETYRAYTVPAAYRALLYIEGVPRDTFLDMRAWGKGVVIVNGYNIGRYWEWGPQQTLYVPAPLLDKGPNEVIVFETEGVTGDKAPPLVFLDKPILQCSYCKSSQKYPVKSGNVTRRIAPRHILKKSTKQRQLQ